jgi:hypothetical protein
MLGLPAETRAASLKDPSNHEGSTIGAAAFSESETQSRNCESGVAESKEEKPVVSNSKSGKLPVECLPMYSWEAFVALAGVNRSAHEVCARIIHALHDSTFF